MWLRAAAVAAAFVAFGATASAASAGACAPRDAERPFLRWLDVIEYTLAPDGGFEGGAAGWTLTGGARVVSGNESYSVRSARDRYSLALPSGSSATTPPVCVETLDLVMRYFAQNGGSLLASLRVDAIYENALGGTTTERLDLLSLSGPAWGPSLQNAFLLANVDGILRLQGATTLRFRFTPKDGLLGKGDWRIDDVYVDPFIMR